MKSKLLSPARAKNIRDIAKARTKAELMRAIVVEKVEPFATIEEIKRARNTLGVSQKGFAEIFGYSTRLIQAWEQAYRTPDVLATKNIRLIIKNPAFARELKAA